MPVGASFTGCTRGAFGSTARPLYGATTGYEDPIYTTPPSWRGRRAYLYGYTLDANGSGSLTWTVQDSGGTGNGGFASIDFETLGSWIVNPFNGSASITDGVFSATGQLAANNFGVTQLGQTTPPLDLKLAYQVAVDLPAQSALVSTFNLSGTRQQQPLPRLVPQRERKHAAQVIDTRVTELFIRMHDDFGI